MKCYRLCLLLHLYCCYSCMNYWWGTHCLQREEENPLHLKLQERTVAVLEGYLSHLLLWCIAQLMGTPIQPVPHYSYYPVHHSRNMSHPGLLPVSYTHLRAHET